MDIVYPYRRAPGDFELRYSLRSLCHVQHSTVIVAGDFPFFASERLRYIAVPPISDRYRSSTENILAAIRDGVTAEFMVMHDDIFMLAPWVNRHEHRGLLADYLRDPALTGGYRKAATATYEVLRSIGIDEPLFFGLHTPVVYEAARLEDVAQEFDGRGCLLRTLYFNLFPAPGVRRDDVKVKVWPDEPPQGDVLSIADNVARDQRFRSWIRDRFPDPSDFERETIPMNEDMIANRSMTYGTRRLKAGETFPASRRDAEILNRIGRARYAGAPATDAVAQGNTSPAVNTGKTNGDLAALRIQYQNKFGKRPFHGWDAKALTEKLAETRD